MRQCTFCAVLPARLLPAPVAPAARVTRPTSARAPRARPVRAYRTRAASAPVQPYTARPTREGAPTQRAQQAAGRSSCSCGRTPRAYLNASRLRVVAHTAGATMMSNFIITLVGLGSVAYLLKSDVRTGSALLKRNLKTIRTWLEEEGATAAKPTGCVVARAAARAVQGLTYSACGSLVAGRRSPLSRRPPPDPRPTDAGRLHSVRATVSPWGHRALSSTAPLPGNAWRCLPPAYVAHGCDAGPLDGGAVSAHSQCA